MGDQNSNLSPECLVAFTAFLTSLCVSQRHAALWVLKMFENVVWQHVSRNNHNDIVVVTIAVFWDVHIPWYDRKKHLHKCLTIYFKNAGEWQIQNIAI